MRLIHMSRSVVIDGGEMPQQATASELYGFRRSRQWSDRPQVELCMVSTLDGVTSLEGRSGRLSGAADRAVLAALRDAADWVLVGAGTVRAERYRSPRSSRLRVAVVSTTGDIEGAELADSDALTLVMPEDAPPVTAPTIRAGHGRVDLSQVLAQMDGEFVHVEGGPQLNAALVAADLVDAINLTFSPRLGGPPTRPVVDVIVTQAERDRIGAMELAWVYEEDGFVFARYQRRFSKASSRLKSAASSKFL